MNLTAWSRPQAVRAPEPRTPGATTRATVLRMSGQAAPTRAGGALLGPPIPARLPCGPGKGPGGRTSALRVSMMQPLHRAGGRYLGSDRAWGKEGMSRNASRSAAFMSLDEEDASIADLSRASPALARLASGGLTERRQGNSNIKSNPFTYTLETVDMDLDVEAEESTEPGTVLGAVALITGSTVGAGVLALPATVAPAGFLPSSAVLVGCWAFLGVEALLMAEVCVACMRERDEIRSEHGREHTSNMVTIPEMAARTLGDFGQGASSALYLFLSVTLLTAYIAKSGEVLSIVTPTNPSVAATVFSLSIATVLCSGGTRAADLLNRGLTFGLLVLFLCVVGAGTTLASWDALGYANWAAAPSCLPIVVLALVYHDLVPVVCSYLDGDVGRIRASLVLGSLVPLGMFVLWDGVALAIAPQAGAVGGDPLNYLMSQVGGDAGSVLPGLVVSMFSVLALATSFIGTSLGLSSYAAKVLQDWTDAVAGAGDGKGGALSDAWESLPLRSRLWWDERGIAMSSFYLILVAPLGIAVYDPSIFLGAATFAGAYGNTMLYGVLPPLMAWQMRPRGGGASYGGVERLVPGGTPVLAATAACAVGIAAARAAKDLGTGASVVADGVSTLADGVPDGIVSTLTDGVSTLADGVSTLADGVSTLADGVSDGVSTLADGVSSLADGVLDLESTAGLLESLGDSVGGLLADPMGALMPDVAAEPVGWLAAGWPAVHPGVERVMDALSSVV